MPDIAVTIMSLCLVFISSINLIIASRIFKRLSAGSTRTVMIPEKIEIPANPQPMAEYPPTTKSEILSWRQRIIAELEQERGTRVITMIHKRELWTGPGEMPEIGLEDAETVLQQIRSTLPGVPIDLILHTPGGIEIAAEMMAMAIKFHPAKVTVFVPFYAFSGGSLMSLAADEIRMERYSMLGPVDPQIATPDGNMWPAGSLESLVKQKPLIKISDKMIVLAEVARLEIENAVSFVMWLLDERMEKEQARNVAEFFAHGYMAHGTPITLDVLRAMGLNAVEEIPGKVYELFRTFGFAQVS